MWLVFRKELKELLRDRKTLFFMIALPILVFPLIFGVVAYFSGKAIEEAQNKVLRYSIIGQQHAPELAQRLSESGEFEWVEMASDTEPAQWVRQEKVDFVLVIPPNYSNDVLTAGQITLSVHLNDSSLNMVEKRLNEITTKIAERNQQDAFVRLGLDASQSKAMLKPIVVEKIDVADQRENWGEKIGGLVPYLVFILCLQGAMIPATDLGAGEKERGTLETLLISPIERYKLVLGKFITIAFAGVTSAMITVSSMAIWGIVLSQGMAIELVAKFMSAISAVDFILMFLMLIPVVAIFASVLLSLSIYARSFKEAQGYMTPLVLVVVVPVILAMLPGMELKGGWAWVPLTNVALAIKELIKGTMDYVQLLAIFSSTVMIAGLFLGFCLYWFNREKVLFR
ncbi:ABC transporter permease [Alteromonas aestuariivivens]|uniref:ABC transporter permease n=1 Tax=Alteromonas aestuariivivens TaxID=1938339 RepID=A0A3D8M7P7_9ALTE|nr:ABC transporter permease [Alteromonas aestuariivivens]RDV25192.1 ABC transporter permease [Alteromonas aestuariivivens]